MKFYEASQEKLFFCPRIIFDLNTSFAAQTALVNKVITQSKYPPRGKGKCRHFHWHSFGCGGGGAPRKLLTYFYFTLAEQILFWRKDQCVR